MKLHFTLLFSLFFICFSFSQEHAIRGFVIDKTSGEPIIFEKIFLLNTDSTIAGGATSDVDGFYNIPKVNLGSYILKIENGTFKKITQNIKVTAADGVTTIKFELEVIEKVTEMGEFVINAQTKIKTSRFRTYS